MTAMEKRLIAAKRIERTLLLAAAPCNALSMRLWMVARSTRERWQRECREALRK